MVLKEAFRMQNKLDELLDTVNSYLYSSGQIMKVTEKHNRRKANPNAEDEEIVRPKLNDYDVNQLIDFAMDLINEKEKLYAAINDVKKGLSVNMDSALAMNKVKQSLAGTLKYLSNIKATETINRGQGYLIDNDGRQSPYCYDITVISTIDFDRNKARSLSRNLSRITDEMSAKIDKINVTVDVDYTPKYYFDDSFDDAFTSFLS